MLLVYEQTDVPEGMTLAEYRTRERKLERALAAELAECERIGRAWLDARAHGDRQLCRQLDAEGKAADRASRKTERKLRKARKRAQTSTTNGGVTNAHAH